MKQFRGAHAPPELFDLVSSGEVSGELAWLALVIDTYVNARGEGCFASNETLGRDIHKSPRQVQLMIRMLRGYRKEKGKWKRKSPQLVRVVGWKKMQNGMTLRILETRWSRLDIDSEWEHSEPEGGTLKVTSRGDVKSNVRGDVKSNPQDIRDRVDKKDVDNPLKGKAAAYHSHSNGNGHAPKGMKALPDQMKRKRFSIQEIDWAKRNIRHHAKATKSKPNRNVMAEASALAALSKRLGRNGDRRIERFIRRMEDGDNQFSASSISHLERLMVIDEQMTKKDNHESGIELEITRNGKHSSGLLRNGVIDEETNHRWVRMPDED